MKKLISISISITFIITYILYKSSFFTNKKTFRPIPFHYTQQHFQENNNSIIQKTKQLEKYNNYCLQTKQKTCTIIPYQNIIADSIRIKSVQYAGQIKHNNTILTQQIQNINNITPYRNYPYIFAQRILPIPKENTYKSIKQKEKSRKNTINIWEKWIVYNCLSNTKTIVQNLDEPQFIKQSFNISKKNSLCQDFRLPQYLAFNYFYYDNNTEKSSNYYKATALSYWASKNSINMPAIVIWKWWQHFKSASIRLEKWKNAINDPNINIENIKYFFNKALYERTLDLITQTTKEQNQCTKDLQCLQENNYIKKALAQKQKKCQNYNQKNRDQHTKCRIYFYWIEHKFIHPNWKLDYPLDPQNFQYARRSDRNDRGIILKE